MMLAGQRLRGIREHADQATGQADQFGGMRALEKLGSLVDGGEQLPRVANIQRNGDRNQRDAVPQFARTVVAAQIDRNHHAKQPPLDAVAMQFEVAPDGRRHQRENDVIHAGSAGVPYGFDICQRNLSPGEFLRPAVENVEAQPLGGKR